MAGGGPSKPGTIIIPWYATGFRGNALEVALNDIAPVALRYGASSYAVYRSRDDKYRFQQFAHFERSLDWERYWEGPEMIELRMRFSGSYQVPVLYGWWDVTVEGAVVEQQAPTNGHTGNGHSTTGGGNGSGAHVGEAA
ncbi:MAG TPA: hypothetical protein VMG80_01795 [Solirubrobacteraceae bacterium]|nr:hypothetical protein [Solirubrobacteraceae bacterium]